MNRRDLLRAAGATALAAAGASTAEANPIRRCTAPQFVTVGEVQHRRKWERRLPQPVLASMEATSPTAGFKYEPESMTERKDWDREFPMHAIKPVGWIAIEDIREASKREFDGEEFESERTIGRIFLEREDGPAVVLNPPIVRPIPTPEERAISGKEPVPGHIVDRLHHKIAPEFWGVEGGFDPEHFWKRLEEMGVTRIPFYQVTMGSFEAEIVPGFRTPVWGYNRQVPGPTFVAEVMGPMVVRFVNELPMETSVHLHGGHTPGHADGHPAYLICSHEDRDHEKHPFNYRDYFYTNGVPKLPDAVPLADDNKWDWSESGSTMWYHDHANDITAHNALMGLGGVFIVTDAWERHLVRNHVLPWQDWDVPENARDIPMVFGDRCICRPHAPEDSKAGELKLGRIHFDPFDHNGYLGSIPICNGMAFPRLDVKAEKYRLRFLNGSLARVYLVELWEQVDENADAVNGPANDHIVLRKVTHPWVRIAKDTWLFPEPVADSSILLGMANRADVIVDFGQLLGSKNRKTFFIVNACDQRNGRGPGHGDNGQARADGANGEVKMPRGHLEDIPNLADTERKEKFGADEGGSNWTKEGTFRVVRIEVTREGSKEGCIFPMERKDVAALYAEHTKMAQDRKWKPQKSALGDKVRKLCNEQKAKKVAVPGFSEQQIAVEEQEVAAAGGPWLRQHVELLDELTPETIRKLPVRVFEFERGRGAWRVSHRFFDEERTDAPIRLGGLEVWHLINRSGGWWHPIHIHLESHQHVSTVFAGRERKKHHKNFPAHADGSDLQPQDQFKHDTTTLGPNTEVKILMRFRTFLGPIVFHCHNLCFAMSVMIVCYRNIRCSNRF